MKTPSYDEVLALHNDFLEQPLIFNFKSSSPKPVATSTVKKQPTALSQLMNMTGLEEIKTEVTRQLSFHRIMEQRKNMGHPVPRRLRHMLLVGSPGTGKTSVARLIAKAFYENGVLDNDNFIETSRAGLVGRFIGDTEANTSDALRRASGGCLFIDEIYSLIESADNQRSNDFGQKVIDTLMPVLSDENSNVMIIGAGYTTNVDSFIRSNPGLQSRFPTILKFADYTVGQLVEIAVSHLGKFDFSLTDEARSRLEGLISSAVSEVRDHGNARMSITVATRAIEALCMRCDREKLTGNDLNIIKECDVPSLSDIFPLHNVRRRSVGFKQ